MVNDMRKTKMKPESRAWVKEGKSALILALAVGTLTACEGLLEVTLPAVLNEDVLDDPLNAEVVVASIIANFECGYSAFGWVTMGHDGVTESIAGRGGGSGVYRSVPDIGIECDEAGDSSNGNWYDQFAIARGAGYIAYERLGAWTDEEVPGGAVNRQKLMATTALYLGAIFDHFGEFYCEMTIDNGSLMTPDQTIAVGLDWLDKAQVHISSIGDYEIPHGASTSAQNMLHGLRARMLWHTGDFVNAATAAALFPKGFTAWVTRDVGPQRRNKPYESLTATGWNGMLGLNVSTGTYAWNPIDRTNPVTMLDWPDPIPFTGYLFLGIMPDGRALSDTGIAVTWAEEFRAAGDDPTPLNNGAVADTRTLHFKKSIQGPSPREVPDTYKSAADDIPLVDWEEIWLIKAEIEGGQFAIDYVNEIRDAYSLPNVTYVDPTNAQQVKYMILEERRRTLFNEVGRFWATKILNTDLLFFPRAKGVTPEQGYNLLGGVRLVMPNDEYELNPNLGFDKRGTGCDPDQSPSEDAGWGF